MKLTDWPRGPAGLLGPRRLDPAPLINLRWLVLLRWGAVAGQLATILVAWRFLGQPIPLGRLLAICGALALINLGVQVWLWRGGLPTDRTCALNLVVDVVGLTSLLALTGGPLNPFSALYLIHITIAAVILPAAWSWLLAAASVVAYSALQLVPEAHAPLSADLHSNLYRSGMWVAFGVAALFISTFTLRMSEALRRRKEELEQLRADAETAERLGALGTLAAGTAHELNTPLGTIAILASELSAQLEGARKEEAQAIRKQVSRCKDIISNMLAPRGGEDLEDPKEIEVAPVLEEALQRWGEGRPGPKPTLQVDQGVRRARARLPIRAFEQTVANLLDNAADATEGQEGVSVRVALGQRGDMLALTVADNGVGVPEQLVRRLGEPFFTTKEPGRGTGLGLYLARHVVERAGGEMKIDSAEGRGTQVTLLVPAEGP
jgi:two-component system sensor histidine kinase RegB